jgi:hypothetical protein
MKSSFQKRAIAVTCGALMSVTAPFIVSAGFSDSDMSIDDVKEQIAAANPEFFVGSNFEFYPMLLDNVAGYDSLIAISNLTENIAPFTICVVPSGTASLQCTFNINMNPRETRFLFVGSGPLGLLANTTGQVFIQAGAGMFGASMAFIIPQQGGGVGVVEPFTF